MCNPASDVPLLLLDTVDSTLLEADRQAMAGRRGPLVICAREQTGGTGRHGRRWASPPGNLYWTVLLDEDADRPRDAGLAFAAGLGVADALEAVGVPAARLGLKWPNDVLLDGRKIAGILVQASVAGQHAHTAVGIGINIATAPPDTAHPAIALSLAGLEMPTTDAVRDSLTRCFMARRAQWHQHGIGPLRDAVAARLLGIGQPARVARDRDRMDVLEGINEGLDATGALLLRTADGVRRTIVAGDVLA